MFIDAYEDSMHVTSNVNSAAGSVGPKQWPPTIDEHSTIGSQRASAIGYTDDDAYEDPDDRKSIMVIDHLASEGVGDYTDAYDIHNPPVIPAHASRRTPLRDQPSGVLSEAGTLVPETASAYATDVEAEGGMYVDDDDAARPATKSRSMQNAGQIVKSLWPYEVMPSGVRTRVIERLA